ncbi:MAG TPA: universal stress protein, partial [Ramlibacter sp.]|nr:universal stress protein [Ramlibacter sp.]
AMKILLAVDGSDYTRRMLVYIAEHRSTFGTGNEYTVFHSVLAVPHRAAAFVGPDMVRSYYDDEARIVLDPIRNFLKEHDIESRFEHEIGNPGNEIAQAAEAGRFDLVVMGSHGHNVFKSLVLGSVATKVLAACTVPVLLVR